MLPSAAACARRLRGPIAATDNRGNGGAAKRERERERAPARRSLVAARPRARIPSRVAVAREIISCGFRKREREGKREKERLTGSGLELLERGGTVLWDRGGEEVRRASAAAG